MQPTDVLIRMIQDKEDDPIRAVISLILHTDLGDIAVHDIKIIKTREGQTLLVMPNRRNKGGVLRDTVHPIDEAARANLEAAVSAAYERRTGRDIRK